MTEAIELHDSDIGSIDESEGAIRICFSEVYIWAEGKGWGQRAILSLEHGEVQEKPAKFPVRISDGVLWGENERFDNTVPLPFSRQGTFYVDLVLDNGEVLKVSGQNPRLELVGERRYIEDAGQL